MMDLRKCTVHVLLSCTRDCYFESRVMVNVLLLAITRSSLDLGVSCSSLCFSLEKKSVFFRFLFCIFTMHNAPQQWNEAIREADCVVSHKANHCEIMSDLIISKPNLGSLEKAFSSSSCSAETITYHTVPPRIGADNEWQRGSVVARLVGLI